MNTRDHIKLLSVFLSAGWILVFACSAHAAGWDNTFPGLNGQVKAIAVDGSGNVYAGGGFTDYVARWNTNTSSWGFLSGLSGPAGSRVDAIAIYGSDVYVAGTFNGRIARWNGSSWTIFSGISGTINALAVDNLGRLYVGGSNIAITGEGGGGSSIRRGYWSYGSFVWEFQTVFTYPPSGVIWSLAFGNGMIYAGGGFTYPGNYIAQLNLSNNTWSALSVDTVSSDVKSLMISGNIYVGGDFITAPAKHFASWSGSAWGTFGTSPDDGTNDSVLAIAYNNTENLLYVGGTFTTAGGTAANYIAAWDGAAWSPLAAEPNGQVNALGFYDGKLYVGGDFTSPASYIGLYRSNMPPIALSDSYIVNEDQKPTPSLTVAAGSGVLANDNDPELKALTAVLVSPPSHGTLNLNTDGSFTYTPAPNYNNNYNNPDSFTYRAKDDKMALSGIATVTIVVNPVNDLPTATGGTYNTAEDTPLTIQVVGASYLAKDVDTGDVLTLHIDNAPLNGTLTKNDVNGSFTYTPNSDYSGSDSFTYHVTDSSSAMSDPVATIIINVGGVNDPPTAVSHAYSTDEDVVLSKSAADGVLNGASDVDGDTLTAVPAAGPGYGTLNLHADGSFTYTPNPNFYGTDGFSYKAFDGKAYSAPNSVTITINSVNDKPVAAPETYLLAQNNVLTVPAPGVLSNDRDIENNAFTAKLAVNAFHGTVALNPDGSFTYTPSSDYYGPDSFTYTANDGSDSNIVTVSFQVDIPVPSMLSVSDVTATTVRLTGNSNTQTASEQGFFWWTDTSASGLIPMVGNSGAGNFSMTVSNLKPLTQYKVSAYIKVGGQLITSDNSMSFTTTEAILPKVTTGQQFSISGHEAVISGEITDVGSTPVSIYGFVYSTSPSPTVWSMALPFTWDMSLPISTGKSFSGTLRNLAAGKYYLRAYAHNSIGTSYGEQIEFTIDAPLAVPGDVNGDGFVDLADAVLVMQILSGISVDAKIDLAADVNGDKRIGIEELAYILQVSAAIR